MMLSGQAEAVAFLSFAQTSCFALMPESQDHKPTSPILVPFQLGTLIICPHTKSCLEIARAYMNIGSFIRFLLVDAVAGMRCWSLMHGQTDVAVCLGLTRMTGLG